MRHLSVLLLAAAACCAQPLAREGPYWVRVETGSLPSASRLKIRTRGPVTLQNTASAGSYRLVKRVRARTEAQARRLLAEVTLTTRVSGDLVLASLATSGSGVPAELHISLPATLQSVSLYTYAGDVRVVDLAADVEAESGGGRIIADRIHGGATLRTGGGDIHLGRISGPARCLSGGGSIHAERLEAESWLETAGGEIVVRQADAPVHLSTAGGNIQVGSARAVWARTAAGRIEIVNARGIVTAGNAGGSIEVGSAAGVRCESSGGTIRLRGSAGTLRAITDVGSILAELISGTPLHDSILSSSAGDITVFIPSNLPVTVRAQQEGGRRARIVSDFPEIALRSDGGEETAWAEGSLNGGGPLLKVSAVSGTIYLRRR